MVPSKLKRHLSTNHGNLESKDHNYFKSMMITRSKEVKYFEKTVTVSDQAQTASYKVAKLFIKQNHTEKLNH